MKMAITFLLSYFLSVFSQSFAEDTRRPIHERYLEQLQERAPRLYAFDQALAVLQGEIDTVLQNYQRKEISYEEAREQLKALFEKQYEIRQSKEYQVEQMIQGALGSSDPSVSIIPSYFLLHEKR